MTELAWSLLFLAVAINAAGVVVGVVGLARGRGAPGGVSRRLEAADFGSAVGTSAVLALAGAVLFGPDRVDLGDLTLGIGTFGLLGVYGQALGEGRRHEGPALSLVLAIVVVGSLVWGATLS